MRSFIAFMACAGCIAWIHSCDKRLLGVNPSRPAYGPEVVADQENIPQNSVWTTILPARVMSYMRRAAPAAFYVSRKPLVYNPDRKQQPGRMAMLRYADFRETWQ